MTSLSDLRNLWSRMSSRERALITLGVLVVVLGVGWPLLWQPIAHDLERSALELARVRSQAVVAQQAADEIEALRRNAKTPRTGDIASAVESVVSARGLRPALTALDAKDGRARLTFAAIELTALAGLIEALGRDEQLFALEATLAARVEAGSVRAELALARVDAR